MAENTRLELIIEALESQKADDVVTMDVKGQSSLADTMVLASGTSSTHLRGMSDKIHFDLKKTGELPLGIEGNEGGSWVLMDYNDIIVHLFLPERREEIDMVKLYEEIAHSRNGD